MRSGVARPFFAEIGSRQLLGRSSRGAVGRGHQEAACGEAEQRRGADERRRLPAAEILRHVEQRIDVVVADGRRHLARHCRRSCGRIGRWAVAGLEFAGDLVHRLGDAADLVGEQVLLFAGHALELVGLLGDLRLGLFGDLAGGGGGLSRDLARDVLRLLRRRRRRRPLRSRCRERSKRRQFGLLGSEEWGARSGHLISPCRVSASTLRAG